MLNPDSERELRNLVETKDIYYVELAHVKELLDEVDRLRKLAYLGEHYFSDLTYKARLEEAIRDLRNTQAQALDAERHRDLLKDQLNYAESYTTHQVRAAFDELKVLKARLAHAEADAEQAVHNEAFMERQCIVAWIRARHALGSLDCSLSLMALDALRVMADEIERGEHEE
jgi:hypothetical protein